MNRVHASVLQYACCACTRTQADLRCMLPLLSAMEYMHAEQCLRSQNSQNVNLIAGDEGGIS